MKIKKEILDKLLRQASYELNGDFYEQNFGNFILPRFPNCELFWKLFVIPLTQRITEYPETLGKNIRPRKEVDPELEDIANTNYTMFLNLVYAHIHLQDNMISSLEDFYVHLGSTCDLVETFLERWFFLLVKCRGGESKTLQKLSREDFLELSGDWYDKNYLTLYEQYFSKGKILPIRIPSRKNIIKELFENYLKEDGLRKRYYHYAQSIRAFRNVVVHDVQVGRVVLNEKQYIPQPQKISNYRTWRQVFSVANDSEIINRDFCIKAQQMQADIIELETILNEIWDLIIKEFIAEFYSTDNKTLMNMYGLVKLDH